MVFKRSPCFFYISNYFSGTYPILDQLRYYILAALNKDDPYRHRNVFRVGTLTTFLPSLYQHKTLPDLNFICIYKIFLLFFLTSLTVSSCIMQFFTGHSEHMRLLYCLINYQLLPFLALSTAIIFLIPYLMKIIFLLLY